MWAIGLVGVRWEPTLFAPLAPSMGEQSAIYPQIELIAPRHPGSSVLRSTGLLAATLATPSPFVRLLMLSAVPTDDIGYSPCLAKFDSNLSIPSRKGDFIL